MYIDIDLDSILAPIPGDNPSGESLKYDPIYDEIKEARRADDVLGLEDSWEGEPKISDWPKVLDLTIEVLSNRSKDIQLAVWLLEALVQIDGFAGYTVGAKVLTGLVDQFWDSVYPEIEDDDLDYRIGPLEYLNNKVSFLLRQVPVTDPNVTPGYSMYDWQESQRLALASAGEREGLIADGKVSIEDLDSAATRTSLRFYETLQSDLSVCLEAFESFDEIVELRFGKEAPPLYEIRNALEEAQKQVVRLLRNKGGNESSETDQDSDDEAVEETTPDRGEDKAPITMVQQSRDHLEPHQVIRFLGQGGREDLLWKDALAKLKSSGIKVSLEMLLGAACSSQSVRDKTNCQILMAKLCLRAGKAELAKPIVDEIEQLVTSLQLDKWESPVWLAEVYDTLYQCLMAMPDHDEYKAKELLTKICQIDVTKALQYN